MKTAQIIAAEIRHGLNFHQNGYTAETGKDYLAETIKRIQLDAAKWGAEQAAKINAKLEMQHSDEHYQGEMLHKQAILTFANNLTIDQLPK